MGNDSNQYFDISYIRDDIEQRAVSSGKITILGNTALFVVALGSSMILARLITPRAFGLFAIAQSLVAITETFRTLGFRHAITQGEDVTHAKVSILFWISLRFNLLIFGIILLVAPLLSVVYAEPIVWPIMSLLGLVLLLRALPAQHESILRRQMLFKHLVIAEVGSLFIGAFIAVILAFYGMQYWALVTREIVRFAIYATYLWVICGWRPASFKDRLQTEEDRDVRNLLKYGGYYSTARVVQYIGREFDTIILGYFVGATGLGYYSKAYRWSLYPLRQVHLAVLNVAVSSISRVKDDSEAMEELVRKLFLPVFALSLYLVGFMFVEAERIIHILLGNQWGEAVLPFRILCVGAFFTSIEKVTKWFYLGLGKTQRQLSWMLLYTPVMAVAIMIGVRWGVPGTAMAFSIATGILTIPSILYCLAETPIQPVHFFLLAFNPMATTLLAIGLHTIVIPHLTLNVVLVDLALSGVVYAFLFLAVWFVLPRGLSSAKLIYQILKSENIAT